LGDGKKHGTGNESDQEAKTNGFELVVKIANAPPGALNAGAVLIRFSIHKEALPMQRFIRPSEFGFASR